VIRSPDRESPGCPEARAAPFMSWREGAQAGSRPSRQPGGVSPYGRLRGNEEIDSRNQQQGHIPTRGPHYRARESDQLTCPMRLAAPQIGSKFSELSRHYADPFPPLCSQGTIFWRAEIDRHQTLWRRMARASGTRTTARKRCWPSIWIPRRRPVRTSCDTSRIATESESGNADALGKRMRSDGGDHSR